LSKVEWPSTSKKMSNHIFSAITTKCWWTTMFKEVLSHFIDWMKKEDSLSNSINHDGCLGKSLMLLNAEKIAQFYSNVKFNKLLKFKLIQQWKMESLYRGVSRGGGWFWWWKNIEIVHLLRLFRPPSPLLQISNQKIFFILACYKILDPLPPKSEHNKWSKKSPPPQKKILDTPLSL